jgi:hypothetical protein
MGEEDSQVPIWSYRVNLDKTDADFCTLEQGWLCGMRPKRSGSSDSAELNLRGTRRRAYYVKDGRELAEPFSEGSGQILRSWSRRAFIEKCRTLCSATSRVFCVCGFEPQLDQLFRQLEHKPLVVFTLE